MGSDPGAEPIFAPDLIIETLVEHKVRFVLVGGRAAQLYGASRPTQDADVVVDYAIGNLTNLSLALDELNWRYRIDGLDDAEAQSFTQDHRMHPQLLEGGSIHTFMTDAGPIDVLRMIPTLTGETPGRDYSQLAAAAQGRRRSRRSANHTRVSTASRITRQVSYLCTGFTMVGLGQAAS